MSELAHGLSIVTTLGPLTESFWAKSEAVKLAPADDVSAQARAVEYLLSNSEQRRSLGEAAARLYKERFDVRHTIATLLGAQGL